MSTIFSYSRRCLVVLFALSLLTPLCATEHWGATIDSRHDSILSLITGAHQLEQPLVNIRQLGAKPVTATSHPDSRPAFEKAMQRAAKS